MFEVQNPQIIALIFKALRYVLLLFDCANLGIALNENNNIELPQWKKKQ